MHIINVSNFKNNSGLYSLGLAISLAIKAGVRPITTIPIFVQQIQGPELAETSEPTQTQQKLAIDLRAELAGALYNDAGYKSKSLQSFIQALLTSDEHLLAEMEMFVNSNAKTTVQLKSNLEKIQANSAVVNKYSNVQISNKNIDAFETKLLHCMNSNMLDQSAVLYSCRDELSIENIDELNVFCKLFSLACGKIEQNAANRQTIVRIFEKWFSAKVAAIYSAGNEHDKYKQLVLLGLCGAFMGLSTDPVYNAKKMYLDFVLEQSWNDIYGNYVRNIRDRDSMFSADELICLATHWNVKLSIEEGSIDNANSVLDPILDVTLTNQSGKRWGIKADDAILESVSTAQDDKFKTLFITSNVLEEILETSLEKPSSSLKASISFKTIRDFFITRQTATGELVLKPINRNLSQSFNAFVEDEEIEKIQSIEKQSNSVIWSYRHRNPARTCATSTVLSGGLVGAYVVETGAAVGGMYGFSDLFFIARAMRAGRVAGRAWETLYIGATGAFINPYALGTVAAFEGYMINRRKSNEFAESIKKAFDLYKDGMQENDSQKLKQAEQILRSEIGQGEDRRWLPTRFSVWMQASKEQYELIYYMLGTIASKLDRDDALSMFEHSCYYAKDNNIKWLSLFSLTKEHLIKLQQNDFKDESSKQKFEIIIKNDVEILSTSNPQMAGSVVNNIMSSFNYVLMVVCEQKTIGALGNIEQILNNSDINVIQLMRPHGKMCEVALTFVQAVCLELKAIESKKLITEYMTPSIEDLLIIRNAYVRAIGKYKDSLAAILAAEQSVEWEAVDTKRTVFVEEIRGYSRRFFEMCSREGILNDNVADLVEQYKLNDKSESTEARQQRLVQGMLARKNAYRIGVFL